MKGCYLSTVDLFKLDQACAQLNALADGCGGVYLVGSVNERADFRDVDVRMILTDPAFDEMFGHSPKLWAMFSYAVSCWLRADTGLPIDFQVQRQSEASEKYGHGTRNPLGGGHRDFAGLGDATRFMP